MASVQDIRAAAMIVELAQVWAERRCASTSALLLLWQRDLKEATRQLELAREAEPGSKIAGEAKRFLDAVRNAGTS